MKLMSMREKYHKLQLLWYSYIIPTRLVLTIEWQWQRDELNRIINF